jgi:DNA invertase Pin-like site-specific DNA recombinase
MAKVTIYLRVSADAQDVANQKLGCLEYITANGWSVPLIIEDTASGKTRWQERPLGDLLATMQSDEILVVSEISRLARSTLQVLEILKTAAEKQISVHIVKSRLVMDGSLSAKTTASVLALAAEIEREFIRARTTEALRKKKEAGEPLGRPKNAKNKSKKLDKFAEDIAKYQEIGLNKTAIAKLTNCTRVTLNTWLHEKQKEGINDHALSEVGNTNTKGKL